MNDPDDFVELLKSRMNKALRAFDEVIVTLFLSNPTPTRKRLLLAKYGKDRFRREHPGRYLKYRKEKKR